jgi:hypothetical protein
MTIAHTPGPWRLNAGNGTEVMTETGLNVARAHCGGIYHIKVAQAEANARLIAAAPELLNLLYRWQASGCPHCPGDCAGANPPSATCIVRATAAAIAKATGK